MIIPFTITKVFILFAFFMSCLPTAAGEHPLHIRRDVSYGPHARQTLDVLRLLPSEDAEPSPALLMLHGGGWITGDKSDLERAAERFARLGLVVINANYRLVRLGANRWPACWEDASAAFDWVFEQAAELGIDTERVGVIGFSAGGHLAALLGTRPETRGRVGCVVNFYGPVDFRPETGGSPPRALFGRRMLRRDKARYADASPMHHVSKDAAPMLTIHGLDDRLVSWSDSRRFHETLREHGAASDLRLYPGVSHAFNRPARDGELTPEGADAWLQAQLFMVEHLDIASGKLAAMDTPVPATESGEAASKSPVGLAAPRHATHPWRTIHGCSGNRDIMPMDAPPEHFEHVQTLMPDHVNWSIGAVHANGDLYAMMSRQPTQKEPDREARAVLIRFSPRTLSVENRVVMGGAAAASPLLAPDGSIYTLEAEWIRRWSEALDPLGAWPIGESEGPYFDRESDILDRERLLIPIDRDGGASFNLDVQAGVIHTITLSGRWIAFDLEKLEVIHNRSLGAFVTNTVAVSDKGTLYYVGIPYAEALARYDEPLARLARSTLPGKYRGMTAGEFLRADVTGGEFLKALLLGNLIDGEQGVIAALIPDGEGGYRRVERFIMGGSESSPAIGMDGSVYISDGIGHVLAFDAGLTHEKWRYTLGSPSLGSIALDASGALYVVGGESVRRTHVIKLIDRGDHAETAWELGGGRLLRDGRSSRAPLKAARSIVTTTTGGVGYLTGSKTGWPGGRLYAFDLESGEVLGEAVYDSPGGFVAALPISTDVLVAFTADLFDLRDRRGLLNAEAGLRVYLRKH